jgi:triphosphatase
MSAERSLRHAEVPSGAGDRATVATEIELKLALPKSAARAVRAHPLLLAAPPPKRTRVRAVYFDTPELALREHSAALRVRRAGGVWTQTFKHGGVAGAGVHSRTEAECEVPGLAPDLEKLAGVPGAEMLGRKRIAGRLIQVFETQFMRTAWQLAAADGSLIEVALDIGEIWSAGRSAPICELELELLAGHPAALYRTALTLQETLPLFPEGLSKAARGYRLFANEEAAPVKASLVRLEPSMRPLQALHVIASSCVAQLEANARGAALGEDPEYIHQMRVALRRLRAAIAVFSMRAFSTPAVGSVPVAAGNAAGGISPELVYDIRSLAVELGAARDWDVFTGNTLKPLCAAFPQHPALAALAQAAEAKRELAYRRVKAVLGAQGYARLLLKLAREVDQLRAEPAGEAGAAAPASLRTLAGAALNKRHKRLAMEARALTDADSQHRHNLRVDSKKVRYAAEFFSGLFDGKAASRYSARLAALQEQLGQMNDIVTARTLLDSLAPDAASAMLVEAWLAGREHDAMQALPAAMNRLAATDRFWKH